MNNRIVYAKNGIDARKAYDELVAKWTPLAPAIVRSLEEAGNQLLTFYEFPRAMWKSKRANLLEHYPAHARRELRRDYNRIVYAKNGIDARKAYDELVEEDHSLDKPAAQSRQECSQPSLASSRHGTHRLEA